MTALSFVAQWLCTDEKVATRICLTGKIPSYYKFVALGVALTAVMDWITCMQACVQCEVMLTLTQLAAAGCKAGNKCHCTAWSTIEDTSAQLGTYLLTGKLKEDQT